MIRGVSFEINQSKNKKILSQILQAIDVQAYNWYNVVEQNEVWANFQGEAILCEENYSGIDFVKIINSEHYIIFLKLQAYCEGLNCHNICTYEEFMKDDCQLLILISDSEYVEIYTKTIEMADGICNTAKQNDFANVEYITDDNDCRTELNIL